jgi:hypothetical protein
MNIAVVRTPQDEAAGCGSGRRPPGAPRPSIPRRPNLRSGSSPIATHSVVVGRFGAVCQILFQPLAKCPRERGLT